MVLIAQHENSSSMLKMANIYSTLQRQTIESMPMMSDMLNGRFKKKNQNESSVFIAAHARIHCGDEYKKKEKHFKDMRNNNE